MWCTCMLALWLCIVCFTFPYAYSCQANASPARMPSRGAAQPGLRATSMAQGMCHANGARAGQLTVCWHGWGMAHSNVNCDNWVAVQAAIMASWERALAAKWPIPEVRSRGGVRGSWWTQRWAAASGMCRLWFSTLC